MIRQPEVYTANQIRFWNCEVQNKKIGKWIPARPIGHNCYAFLWRWGIALKVLFGIYDAIDWQEPKRREG